MVYVFGIDVPLMELLLVYSFLALYFLILVFLELRKLTKLKRIEKADIRLMERKSKSPIDKFINEARKSGYSKRDVKKILQKKGWEKKKINRLLVRY